MSRRRSMGAVILLGAGLAAPQTPGVILTASEIEYPHLMAPPTVVEGRAWLGLRVTGEGSHLEPVEARWQGALEFGDSTFTLETSPTGFTLLLAEVPGVTAGPVTTLTSFEETLSRDAPLSFDLEGRAYTLALGGTDPGFCDATVTLGDGVDTQDLYFPAESPWSCDDPHFSVQWAGDLDGDGRLDLVTTLSSKYSVYPRVLWLSSAAPGGAMVAPAAVLESTAA